MHAIKGGWVGQTFALASSCDAGGKKSRIRRSKEERKIMVESFINKYQKSNNGNFPSLTLTHKKVGGSFYTVREIFREMIQENRVLAPPKVSLEEHNHSGYLEQQHTLGSTSIEPRNDWPVSDKHQFVTPIEPNQHQVTSEDLICSSSGELENQKIVNGGERLEENMDSDEHFTTSAVIVNHQDDNNDGANLSSQEIHALGSQRHSDEQYLGENNQIVDKTEVSREETYTESVVTSEKDGGKDLEVPEAVTSHMNTNFSMETFPSRPVCEATLDLDGESGKLHEANEHDKMAFVKSNGSVKDQETLDSAMELNAERRDENVVQNLKELSSEDSKFSISLPDETKACSSTERIISEDSMAFVTKSRVQDNLLKKGNNLMLERLDLETWKRTSKKSTTLENNPVLTFVKTFISAFVKFWTQ